MPEFGDADENIVIKFTVDTQKAIEEAKALRKQIDELKSQVKTVAKETGETTSVAVQAVLNTAGKTAKGAGSIVKKEYTAAEKAAGGFKDSLSSLGSVGKFVFGTVLGLGAVQILRNIIGYFQQAAQYGYEFAKAVFQLQIGINAIRRVGVEITLQDMYENLDKLQAKFGIFSRKELVEGAAQLINLTRDFGMTKDQIFELQDAIATLAVVNGRAMDDVQRTVALAISSGYTEGLQRLGVSINRVTIALEAERLGFGRNYMSLTETQRAQATYNLILQKTAKYQDDLEEYQRTAPGRIDAAKASFTNLATTIGELVIPVWADFVSWLGRSADALDENIRKMDDLRKKGIQTYGSRYGAAQYTLTPTQTPTKEPIIETGFLKNAVEDYENMLDKLGEVSGKLWDETLEIQDEYTEKLNDNYEDWLQDREDLLIRYNQKAEDIERDFAQKLEDIEIGVAQKNEDAWRDYYQELEDINIWYNQAVEDANYDHQQELLKNEEDFQEEMRKLRQKFLFDLEDAVRERDAKQAMLLIRQYNFDRQQAQQDRDDNEEEINKDFQQELAELKRQKARKLAEAKDELNRKFAEIQREYQRELEELQIWKQREYEERELWYQRELEQADANLRRQNEAAAKARDDALRDLVKSFTKEYELTNKHWLELFKLTDAYVGNNGALTQLIRNFAQFYASAMAAVSSPYTLNPSMLSPMQQVNWGGSYAQGGEITVRKPTLALFEERGTEAARFTPGNRSKGDGKLAIALSLSPDLEARIIDNAIGEFADIVVSVEKSK